MIATLDVKNLTRLLLETRLKNGWCVVCGEMNPRYPNYEGWPGLTPKIMKIATHIKGKPLIDICGHHPGTELKPIEKKLC